MTRYRLPEALGGGEYDAVRIGDYDLGHRNSVYFRLPGINDLLALPLSILTPVEPPIPPEPPVGSVVLDQDRRAWQNTGFDAAPWHCAYEVADEDWAGLNTYGPLTLLVPAVTP